MNRELTERDRAVLDFLLTRDFDGVEALRGQAQDAVVSGMCGRGCPSIDFAHPRDRTTPGSGRQRVHPWPGRHYTLFLITHGQWLGGIEYVGVSGNDPSEYPDPSLLEFY